ncbi:hypothetical protein X975_20910, partial [Stegodyphus mimosarum]
MKKEEDRAKKKFCAKCRKGVNILFKVPCAIFVVWSYVFPSLR